MTNKTMRSIPQPRKTPKKPTRPRTIRIPPGGVPAAAATVAMYLGGIANLYRHRGQFVRAVRNGDTVTLCPLSLAELQNELECCFVFVRVATLEYLGGDDDGEIIDCPPRLVKMLMTYCNDCGAVPEIESAADIERVSE